MAMGVRRESGPKLYYLLVCTTCTHQSGHRCPDCFAILLLRCFDVYGSQIGSTESGNPVWTYDSMRTGAGPHGRHPMAVP